MDTKKDFGLFFNVAHATAEGEKMLVLMLMKCQQEATLESRIKEFVKTTTRLRIKSCYLCYMANPLYHD